MIYDIGTTIRCLYLGKFEVVGKISHIRQDLVPRTTKTGKPKKDLKVFSYIIDLNFDLTIDSDIFHQVVVFEKEIIEFVI